MAVRLGVVLAWRFLTGGKSCGYFSNFRGEPATISASYKKLLLGFVNFWLKKHVLGLIENLSKGIRVFRPDS
jgi:hypothetical protein